MMSWKIINRIIGLASINPDFRQRLQRDPLLALKAQGIVLTAEELEVFKKYAALPFAQFCQRLYPQQILVALQQSSIPAWLTPSVAGFVIILELESALALLFSTAWSLPLAFLGALILLGIFTGWILRVLRQNLQVSCGCFGPNHAQVNTRYLVRNSCFKRRVHTS